MLIELFGRNFASFRDEFRLSMLATDIDPGNNRGAVSVNIEGEDESLRLLRSAAIYGPNASGKSNLLRAARALNFLLGRSGYLSSDDALPPYEPFLLDKENANLPVMLGVRAIVDRHVYEYSVEFEATQFLREELVEMNADGNKRLFLRVGHDVSGSWTQAGQFQLLTESFRPNALLLSLADRLAPSLAKGIAVGLRRVLQHHGLTWASHFLASRRAARLVAQTQGFQDWLVEWLRDADIGIVDCHAEKVPNESDDEEAEQMRTERSPDYSLDLMHAGSMGPVKLDYRCESMGTRKMVELAPIMRELLHGDSVRAYFVDEIGASMHPSLLAAVVRRFNCDARPEDVRGQLIFATQETTLLDAEAKDAILRRDQVYLTEKDSSGASRLSSVADFKERNNLNLRRRYLQGRYGALPAVGRLGD